MTNCLTAATNRIAEINQNMPKKKYAMADVLDPRRTRTMPAPIHAMRMGDIGFLVTDIKPTYLMFGIGSFPGAPGGGMLAVLRGLQILR